MSPLNATSEKPLAVLCVHVDGGVDWARSLGNPEAVYVVERCAKRIRRSMEMHGGRVVDSGGRKLMAYFANGSQAFKSAIEIHHRVSALPPHSGYPLAVGVGLCAGHQSREGRYFPPEGDNPAAHLSAAAQPGRILVSVPRRARLFPWLELAGERISDVALHCGKRRLGIFQVPLHQPEQMALSLPFADAGDGAGRLRVRFRGLETVLDESQPITRIGRLPDSDVVVTAERCSREHGRIERRLDRFVFVDQSTNGTFVTLEKQAEVWVHRKEVLLFGRGQLSFGTPASARGAEVIRFHMLGLAD